MVFCKNEEKKSIINRIIGFDAPAMKNEIVRIKSSAWDANKAREIRGLVVSVPDGEFYAEKNISGERGRGKIEAGSWVIVKYLDFLKYGGNVEVIGNMYYFDIICYKINIVDGPDISRLADVYKFEDYRKCLKTKKEEVY